MKRFGDILSWIDPEPYRHCPGCQLEYPESAFAGPDGQAAATCSRCQSKQARRTRIPRQRTPAMVRAHNLQAKYGITVEDYEALRVAQSRRCAICRTHEDDLPAPRLGRPRKDGKPPAAAARLVVDHCHTSGRVRGLLCSGCNSAIGHFGESPAAMLAAIRYLGETADTRPV